MLVLMFILSEQLHMDGREAGKELLSLPPGLRPQARCQSRNRRRRLLARGTEAVVLRAGWGARVRQI